MRPHRSTLLLLAAGILTPIIALAAVPTAADMTAAVNEDSAVNITLRGGDTDGDALTYTIVSGPTRGTISLSGKVATYTPSANVNGTDSFTYRATDPSGNVSNTATVSITINATNDVPTVTAATYTGSEDNVLTFSPSASDVDGDALTWSITTAPTTGTASIDAATGLITYTPTANWSGSTTLRVNVSDGRASAGATMTIVMNAVNDGPTATSSSITVNEDGTSNSSLSATDIDTSSASLTYTIASGPSHGTASLSGRTLTYVPTGNYNGPDSLTFTVSDGALSSTGTVSITVNPANDPPSLTTSSVTTSEDAAITFNPSATDIDGDALSWTITTAPANGTATIDAASGAVTYTPPAEWSGTTNVRVSVTDGVATAGGTFGITVTTVNDTPVVTAATGTVAKGGSVSIPITATDPDNASLSFSVSSAPAHGTATFSGRSLVYTNSNWAGTETLQVVASDGTNTSVPATVTITVTGANAAPTLSTTSVTTAEDTPITFTPAASDAEGDPLSWSLVSAPANGTATINSSTGAVTFTPTADWSGSTSFTVQVSDGTNVTTGAVNVSVTAVNDAPVGTLTTATVTEDTAVTVALTGTDVDSTSLSYALASNPAHGTASLSGRNLTYVPTANYAGSDTLTYTVSDGSATSTPVTLNLSVTGTNDAPSSATASFTTPEDTPYTLDLVGTDVDGDALTWSISTAPVNGSVSINAATGRATFTPPTNWSGSTSFRYAVTDGTVSSTAQVTVTVTAVNDTPVASSPNVTATEDRSSSYTLSATDPETPATSLTYAIASMPTHGTVSLSGRVATYTPASNYYGPDTFTFTASDGLATSTPGTVRINVNAVNDAPTASALSATTNEDAPVSVALVGADIDSTTLTYSADTTVTGGTVSISGNIATFTPNANFNGTGSFRYRVNDGLANSTWAQVTVTVNALNDAPVAANQSLAVTEDSGASYVTLSASDPDSGSALTYALASMPAHGTVSLSGRSARYTPEANFAGTDSFTFYANDGLENSNLATVTISVSAVNDAPVIYTTAGMSSGGTVEITAYAEDVDSSIGAPTIAVTPMHGTASIVAGRLRYRPDAGYIGMDRVTVSVTDGVATTSGVVKISVVPEYGAASSQLSQVGVNSVPLFGSSTGGEPTSALPQDQGDWIFGDFNDLGIESFRQMRLSDATWAAANPAENSFHLALLNAMLAFGYQEPRVTLFETRYASPTPPWATTTAEFQKAMGTEAYEYLDGIVSTYADDMRYWELGNEMYHWVAADPPISESALATLPDSHPTDGYSPTEQGGFLHDAAVYVSSLDPDGLIVLPAIVTGTSGEGPDWLRDVVTAEGSDWFDVVNYHAYRDWETERRERANFDTLLEDLGLQDKLVQMTETGASALASNTDNTNYPNSPETQCADLFRRFVAAWALGDSSTIWHSYRDLDGPDTAGGFEGYGLFAADETARPVAWSMQLLTSELLPFVSATDATESGTEEYRYRIASADGSVHWVVWGTGSVTVPSGMTEMTSVYPNADGTFTWTPVSAGSSLTLSDTPVLLR